MPTIDAETHAHAMMNGVTYASAVEQHSRGVQESAVRAHLKAYADRAVTYVRDGGDLFGVADFARSIAGEYGIQYRSPSFAIHRQGNYGAIVGRGFTDIASFRALVVQAESQGADFIKVMASGIMDFDNYGQVSEGPLGEEELCEMVDFVHGRSLAMMVHANGIAVASAVKAKADSIEHGYYQDEATLKLLAASDTVWVPTLAPVANLIGRGMFSDDALTRILAGQKEAILKASSLGARLALGSDAGALGVLHGQGIADEAALFETLIPHAPSLEMQLNEGIALIKKKFAR